MTDGPQTVALAITSRKSSVLICMLVANPGPQGSGSLGRTASFRGALNNITDLGPPEPQLIEAGLMN
jgi:hypothetical protein